VTDQANPASRPWRRFLRLSVRGMIVIVVVMGAGLGWLVRSARIQREAVAAIHKAGGRAYYGWTWSEGIFDLGGKPWAPRYLVDLIGVDYFGHVTMVVLDDNEAATDATIEQVGRLTELWRLILRESSVDDASLVHLKGLSDLKLLELGGGLADLSGLTGLTELNLWETQVSDAGLAHLKGLANLTNLGLSGTQITDSGLTHLKGLPKLSELNLGNTKASDAGVIARLKDKRTQRRRS
jgi:internalin A